MQLLDSVNPNAIPAGAPAVAGYIDGLYAWPAAGWARFPHALKVTISVIASADADVLDVETGDATPAQAPMWAWRQRQTGGNPVVYCNSSTWPQVAAAFSEQKIPQPRYWIAQYDGIALIPLAWVQAGCVGKQFARDAATDIDYSTTLPTWLQEGEPVPLAKPAVAIKGTKSGNGYWIFASDGGVFSYGDAVFHGSLGSDKLAAPIVGADVTPTGDGYWLVGADGGVFAFGDAVFHGTPAG